MTTYSKEDKIKKITTPYKKDSVESISKPTTIQETITDITNNTNPTPFKPKVQLNTFDENEISIANLDELEIEAFKTIQPKINTEIQKLPECLEAAQTKSEAFSCQEKLRELDRQLAMAMGDFSEENITGYDDDFIWNEETKINMIQEIEASTETMQEMQGCIEMANTSDELKECIIPEDLHI